MTQHLLSALLLLLCLFTVTYSYEISRDGQTVRVGWLTQCGAVGQESTVVFRIQRTPTTLTSDYSVQFEIDWGDGSDILQDHQHFYESGTTVNTPFTHTYQSQDSYNLELVANIRTEDGSFPNNVGHTNKETFLIQTDACFVDDEATDRSIHGNAVESVESSTRGGAVKSVVVALSIAGWLLFV